ncbi:MAG TPA: hypothetical protein VNT03_12590 [Baekduia sp.]|nr:hypothetical protein [Baekduia sp.]
MHGRIRTSLATVALVAFGTAPALADQAPGLGQPANADGSSDVAQDSADLVLTGSGPDEIGVLDGWSHAFTVRNAGPDAALGTTVEIRAGGISPPAAGPGGASCRNADPGVAGVAIVCPVGTLARGASVTITPSFMTPSAWPPPGGTFTSTATATATTPDPDPAGNMVVLRTVVRAYVPDLPPQPAAVAPPCGNVTRGTRDDDALRGTVFGDRLVGSDGGDLLRGGGGDDCLEGDAGNDVLDGGDGNDRLAGDAGRDRLAGGTGDDKLTGGRGNDQLSAGPGTDTLSPGAGHDSIDAGGGDDTINSVDGVRETVACGAGRDTVRADRRDTLKHCENVTRRT